MAEFGYQMFRQSELGYDVSWQVPTEFKDLKWPPACHVAQRGTGMIGKARKLTHGHQKFVTDLSNGQVRKQYRTI